MDTTILENLGFTKGEIRVYLALLELGSVTTGLIITKSNVARSKVYEILEKLKLKGLVTEMKKGKLTYFQAVSPKKIYDYIKKKEEELYEKKKEFTNILPTLIQKQEISETKQEVKMYVGVEGVKTYYDEILVQMTSKDEFLVMAMNWEGLIGKAPTFIFRNFHMRRSEKKANARVLTSVKELSETPEVNFSDTKLYEFKVTKIPLPAGICIFKDSVATFNWTKIPKVFVIISQENADQYRKFFNYVWKIPN